MEISTGPFEWASIRKAIFALFLLFAGCNHLVRVGSAGAPVLGGVAGAGDMLGFALGSLNTARINGGYIVHGSAKYCPTSVAGYCYKTTNALSIVLGLTP